MTDKTWYRDTEPLEELVLKRDEYDRLMRIEKLAGEFVTKHLLNHRFANPDGPCGCGLCNQARELQAEIRKGVKQ